MRDYTGKKPGRGFTAMIKLNVLMLTLLGLTATSCRKNNINTQPIQDVPVNITINLSLPSYSHLENPGTFVYEQGGVKGVVVVHHTDDVFYAFDRNCSFQPDNACSRIEVDSNFLVFRCGETKPSGFEKCCDSRFFMDGQVFNGPAAFGLKHYLVVRSGNILNIKN